MSYGIRLRNTTGSTLMEPIGQSACMVYRRSLGAITNGTMATVSDFDPTCGVVLIIVNGGALGGMPLHTISGDVVTFHWNGSFGTIYVLYMVMFS